MKKLIALAVASILSAPVVAQAEDHVSVSGFADIIYTVSDDASANSLNGAAGTESKFTTDGEIDFSAKKGDLSVRVDLDVTRTSSSFEQMFLELDLEGVTMKAGIFNTGLSADGEDAPALNFTAHSLIYGIYDNQTALNGNNVAGVAFSGKAGLVSLSGALVNDLKQNDEENSIILMAGMSPMKGLDVELSYTSQSDNNVGAITSTGDLIDLNAQFSMDMFSAGIDYLIADKEVDTAYEIWGGVSMGKFGAKIRLENVSYEKKADTDRTSIYGSYQARDNLSFAIELTDTDTGATSNKATTVEIIATF